MVPDSYFTRNLDQIASCCILDQKLWNTWLRLVCSLWKLFLSGKISVP